MSRPRFGLGKVHKRKSTTKKEIVAESVTLAILQVGHVQVTPEYYTLEYLMGLYNI